jgi:hypothetical protein
MNILLIRPVVDLETLHLLFRMQESRFKTPSQEADVQVYNPFSECRNHSALHGGWDAHSSAFGLQTQQFYLASFKHNFYLYLKYLKVKVTSKITCFLLTLNNHINLLIAV